MKIHFVCTGNTFRSRLAEAYLNSKKIIGLEVSSSGIEADKNYIGPICWYAARIIRRNNLVDFMSNFWQKTTRKIIEESDMIIFMKTEHYEFCKGFLSEGQKYEIWDIEDIASSSNDGILMDILNIRKTENIYGRIKGKIDALIVSLNL